MIALSGVPADIEVVGLRPGEKLHEEMITASDAPSTVDLGHYYAILPAGGRLDVDQYCKDHGGKPVAPGFHYSSDVNDDFLSVEQMRALILAHVDPAL